VPGFALTWAGRPQVRRPDGWTSAGHFARCAVDYGGWSL